MTDIDSENDDLQPMDSDINPLPPGQPVGANVQDGLDELLSTHAHHPSSAPFIIRSDMDSDLSDDEDESCQSHHQEPVRPPSRLI